MGICVKRLVAGGGGFRIDRSMDAASEAVREDRDKWRVPREEPSDASSDGAFGVVRACGGRAGSGFEGGGSGLCGEYREDESKGRLLEDGRRRRGNGDD